MLSAHDNEAENEWSAVLYSFLSKHLIKRNYGSSPFLHDGGTHIGAWDKHG